MNTRQSKLDERFLTLREALTYSGAILAIIIAPIFAYATYMFVELSDLKTRIAIQEAYQIEQKQSSQEFYNYHKQQMESIFKDLRETNITLKELETILKQGKRK